MHSFYLFKNDPVVANRTNYIFSAKAFAYSGISERATVYFLKFA